MVVRPGHRNGRDRLRKRHTDAVLLRDSKSKIAVWDWKSGEPGVASYLEKAKADFATKHPGVTVEFVAQPFDQYYTLLGAATQSGKGPDVMLFNGGGQIRDRVSALLPLDPSHSAKQLQTYGTKCLDAESAGTANGIPIILWTCNGDTNQKWTRS
jgi:ABC-type glycerol-3-phosphate transport system substrate-binding protein